MYALVYYGQPQLHNKHSGKGMWLQDYSEASKGLWMIPIKKSIH